ncbi:MAG: hypothetical protein OXF56_25945 [Rhodobacteraceae bacterium]|nr:hypothetical protein [Paracoccaceae bacterium]
MQVIEPQRFALTILLTAVTAGCVHESRQITSDEISAEQCEESRTTERTRVSHFRDYLNNLPESIDLDPMDSNPWLISNELFVNSSESLGILRQKYPDSGLVALVPIHGEGWGVEGIEDLGEGRIRVIYSAGGRASVHYGHQYWYFLDFDLNFDVDSDDPRLSRALGPPKPYASFSFISDRDLQDCSENPQSRGNYSLELYTDQPAFLIEP